jgi:hypothetical protein
VTEKQKSIKTIFSLVEFLNAKVTLKEINLEDL